MSSFSRQRLEALYRHHKLDPGFMYTPNHPESVPSGGLARYLDRLDDKVRMATHRFQQGFRLQLHEIYAGLRKPDGTYVAPPPAPIPYFWLGADA